MNKYLQIFATSFKQESKTITNTLISAGSFVVILFIFYELWGYIYGEGGTRETIQGYTLQMMIWYLVGTELLMYTISHRKITQQFSADIKSGRLAYQLNKPYSYFLYSVFYTLGQVVFKFMFLLPITICVGIAFVGLPNYDWWLLLPVVFSLIMGFVVMSLFYGAIGLIAFWVEEVSPYAWIANKFLMILGMFFPLEFFPNWLQPVILYSPIYATLSGPCKLLANFSWDAFLQVSASQIIWGVLLVALGGLLFKKGTKKVNINGG